jgi:hypothetical protein
MDFRTEVNIPPSENRISHDSGILFMGSCFTENIGFLMQELRFRVDLNPFGINYNPSSLSRNLWALLNTKLYTKKELHEANGRWFSFDHHSQFPDADPGACLDQINERIKSSRDRLSGTGYLLITWGTAWVYVLKESANVVSNCHKLPSDKFSRHLLSVNQVVDTYTKLFAGLRTQVPQLKIILTVSPVRHWKDGPVLNSVSKSTLLLAAHRLTEMFSYCEYFPAYEIAMDDLRDYRYYADDLVHPNQQMIRYIWEKFSDTYFDENTKKLMGEIGKLNAARNHRPFDPSSKQYQQFCRKQLEKVRRLEKDIPGLDLAELAAFFSEPLKKT